MEGRLTDGDIVRTLLELSEKYPEISSVDFEYRGSGDSFDSYDMYVHRKDGEGGRFGDSHGVDSEDFESMFWEMVERAGSDFNDDGSSGTVTFDLIDRTANIDDNFHSMTTTPNANITVGLTDEDDDKDN